MSKIITIGREYGSGGHKVGQLLAQSLCCRYYDKELLLLAAERGGLDPAKYLGFEEKGHNPFCFTVSYEGNEQVPKGEPVGDILYALQKQVILQIASQEDAVIVGRCADAILAQSGIPRLSVFIAAPFDARVERTCLQGLMDRKTVEKQIRQVDKQRKKYYEAHTGKKWGVPESYDLYLDTAKFHSLNEVADRILEQI